MKIPSNDYIWSVVRNSYMLLGVMWIVTLGQARSWQTRSQVDWVVSSSHLVPEKHLRARRGCTKSYCMWGAYGRTAWSVLTVSKWQVLQFQNKLQEPL